MVKFLLEQGYDVYITSWKNPGSDMHDTSFDEYITDGVAEAVRVARELSGAPKVHAVGYCIGGTLLSVYMARASRMLPREDVPVAHWTLLATLVDFQSPGDIEVFVDEGSVNWLADKMRERGYLDGSEMASTFRLLRSNSLIWHYLVHGWLYGEPLPPSVTIRSARASRAWVVAAMMAERGEWAGILSKVPTQLLPNARRTFSTSSVSRLSVPLTIRNTRAAPCAFTSSATDRAAGLP